MKTRKIYGSPSQKVSERELRNTAIGREIAARGMVLLENKDHCLPLATSEAVALYGEGARHTLHCGLGAASVRIRKTVTVEEGLKAAGYRVTNEKYLDMLDDLLDSAEKAYYQNVYEKCGGNTLGAVMMTYSNPYVPPVQPLLTEADVPENTKTAIYVLTRNSGEGCDRAFAPGDYLLSEREAENLSFLGTHFDNVIMLLNTGGVIDTSFIEKIPAMKAVVVMNQGGNLTGHAVADIISGRISPEGKLTDTWAKHYEDYPSSAAFIGAQKNAWDDNYTDGLYVGYRYFDTFNVSPAYPFGYGLSYTDFDIQPVNIRTEQSKVVMDISVKNIGNTYAGHEVVQVYVSAPEGVFEQPYQELRAFVKTKLLLPGDSETVTVEVDVKNLASYDVSDASWKLEKGTYIFRVGNSSRNTHIVAVWTLDETVVTAICENQFNCENVAPEMSARDVEPYSYPDEKQELLQAVRLHICPKDIETVTYDYHVVKDELISSGQLESLDFADVVSGKMTLDAFIAELSVEDMAMLCVGGNADNEHFDPENEMDFVAAGSGTTGKLEEKYGILRLPVTDGAGGIRVTPELDYDADGHITTNGILSIEGMEKVFAAEDKAPAEGSVRYYQYVTGLPIATLIAQTWDEALMRKAGEIISEEMEEFGIGLWLAPALNIHRNPLCGRNFEYFSEDPLISGKSAAGIVLGLQKRPGFGATIKHMACNNQEEHRNCISANVSERTLRQIYLKGFEIAVREAAPASLMTSYNLINGIHAANHYGMLTGLLRCEWGYKGVVMTDFGTTGSMGKSEDKYPGATAEGCIQAGNDLVMPGSTNDIKAIIKAVEEGRLSKAQLQWCTRNFLKMLMDSYVYR